MVIPKLFISFFFTHVNLSQDQLDCQIFEEYLKLPERQYGKNFKNLKKQKKKMPKLVKSEHCTHVGMS